VELKRERERVSVWRVVLLVIHRKYSPHLDRVRVRVRVRVRGRVRVRVRVRNHCW
jgi:hypothetical protein